MNDDYQNVKREAEEEWAVNEPNFYEKQAVGTETIGEISPAAKTPPISVGTKEDWVMDNSTAEIPLAEEQDEWKMPEPVFRVSSGKKLDKSNSAAPPSELQINQSETFHANAPKADIQPQPYITEDFIADDIDAIEKPPAKERSKTARIIFIAVGILAIVVFVIGFLVGVYFLFIHKPDGI